LSFKDKLSISLFPTYLSNEDLLIINKVVSKMSHEIKIQVRMRG